MSSHRKKKNTASLTPRPLGQQLQMKCKQSTCQDKIRLPQSARFDPISVSDLGFSCAHDNKGIRAEVVRHKAVLRACDAFHLCKSWEKRGCEIRYFTLLPQDLIVLIHKKCWHVCCVSVPRSGMGYVFGGGR